MSGSIAIEGKALLSVPKGSGQAVLYLEFQAYYEVRLLRLDYTSYAFSCFDPDFLRKKCSQWSSSITSTTYLLRCNVASSQVLQVIQTLGN